MNSEGMLQRDVHLCLPKQDKTVEMFYTLEYLIKDNSHRFDKDDENLLNIEECFKRALQKCESQTPLIES